MPLSRLQLKQELIADYRELLPAISLDQARRIRGEQEIIVRYEPEKAIETLPVLLGERADRDRLLTLLDRLLADERVQRVKPSAEQLAMLERIRTVLGSAAARRPRVVVGEVMQRRPEVERKHEKYERLLALAKTLPPLPTAVVHPCDESSLTRAPWRPRRWG